MANLARGFESLNVAMADIERSLSSSSHDQTPSSQSFSSADSTREYDDEEFQLQWAAIERLPTFKRLRTSLFDHSHDADEQAKGKRLVDVTELGAMERHSLIEKLIQNVEEDHRLLHFFPPPTNSADVKLPTVEVQYKNLLFRNPPFGSSRRPRAMDTFSLQ